MQSNYFSKKISKEDFHKYKLLIPLLEIYDIPKELYFKSKNENILNNFLNKEKDKKEYKILTIVGSRKNSNYGKDCVEYFLKLLKDYPIIIVSGLAFGIDTLAHQNALKNNLPTISIPGSGLSFEKLYPIQNINLAKEILEKENIFMSEWEDNVKSELYFFPKRNRIMAAISDAVLIVEAGEKSGTLITARLAMEYGKNVGVIPNNIFSENSIGSNELIKNGATPITKLDDILEMLNITKYGEQENIFNNLNINENKIDFENLNISENEKIILEIIIREGNIQKEILIQKLELENNLTYTDVVVALMQLEINNFIKEEFGEIRIKK